MKIPKTATILGALAVLSALYAAGAPEFTLSSPAFTDHARIPESAIYSEQGCTGGNRSPALRWQGAPAGTKSFLLTLFDLDEHGSPSGWWHWIVYNIPASMTELPEGAGAEKSPSLPKGALQGRVDTGHEWYDGPCPDKGQAPHRYLFTVYALDVESLSLPASPSGALATYVAQAHVLGKATLIGRYAR